jgi:hypothetical protein
MWVSSSLLLAVLMENGTKQLELAKGLPMG